mmetsp:Transcript_18141/g.44511  ORF Transcript_18141/g.44511 Transcript_18141/m.44511 type:complete len:112 (+) Transcript_18141:255-590(+)
MRSRQKIFTFHKFHTYSGFRNLCPSSDKTKKIHCKFFATFSNNVPKELQNFTLSKELFFAHIFIFIRKNQCIRDYFRSDIFFDCSILLDQLSFTIFPSLVIHTNGTQNVLP